MKINLLGHTFILRSYYGYAKKGSSHTCDRCVVFNGIAFTWLTSTVENGSWHRKHHYVNIIPNELRWLRNKISFLFCFKKNLNASTNRKFTSELIKTANSFAAPWAKF